MLLRRVGLSRGPSANPYSDIESVRREVFRLFDSLASERSTDAGAGVYPPVNVTHDENTFYVRAELPGMKSEDLSISAVRNRVSISGRRQIAGDKEGAAYHRREREEGTFNRTITLPQPVDADRVEARYVDGILLISLPKSEDAKPRQIQVKTS